MCETVEARGRSTFDRLPRAGAIGGKRYVKGTKTLPIEPLTVKEVRKAVEGREARLRSIVKP